MTSTIFFEFQQPFKERESVRNVCVGPKGYVGQFLSDDDFSELFGGWIEFRGKKKEEFRGVWGSRNLGRFRRVLRERGAEFSVESRRPSSFELKLRSVR